MAGGELIRRCSVAAVAARVGDHGDRAAASYAALVTADALSRAWQVAPAGPVVVLFVWGVMPHLLP